MSGDNHRLKLLYLMRIFLNETDDTHGLTLQDILRHLERWGIVVERKTIYTDLEALRSFGLDIITEKKGRSVYYYLGTREFELAELKLLVDSVVSSRFITEKKSRELIRKLEGFASKYEAKELHRQLSVPGRIKTMNETIYYNVDCLHEAIDRNVQIRFQYFQWNAQKEMVLRRDGGYYQISPWELFWADEKYYLVGYEAESDILKHFRIDKMLRIDLLEEEREGRSVYEAGRDGYRTRLFGMYGGNSETVRLECENHLAGAMIDRFGKDIWMHRLDDTHFAVNVEVAVSPQFIGWVLAFGRSVRVTAPDRVVELLRVAGRDIQEMYGL